MNKTAYLAKELRQSFEPDQKLSEVFRDLEVKALQRGEIVCRFVVNGLNLTEADEKKFADFRLDEVEILEIETQTPDTLLAEVIANWIQSLPRLIQKSDELSQTMRFKGVEEQMAQFVDVVDSCQFLVESLMSLRTLCQSYEFIQLETWKKSEELTARAIAEALSSFEKKDFVLLADVLEYDLGHCLQSWLETLKELKEHVDSRPPKRQQDSFEPSSGALD